MSLAKTLKKAKKPKRLEPIWKGPEVGGITQSMLSRFLVCRERFRLLVIEGLRPAPQFNHRIEYGHMWHICEEAPAIGQGFASSTSFFTCVFDALKRYCRQLCKTYPLQQEQIDKWYNVCKVQFPIYIDYWASQETKKIYRSVSREEVFNVPYLLPSGRIVRLRGKWDGIGLEDKKKNAGLWLIEHKTRGDLSEEQITSQLQFDLQTMFYLMALKLRYEPGKPPSSLGAPIKGVRYNCVRRPLSGGKGSIRPHKATKTKAAETMEHYYERLGQYIKDEPEYYFMRWTVAVTQADIDRFKREFLNPILEQLCDWWDYIKDGYDPFSMRRTYCDGGSFESRVAVHWRHPFGVYNVLNEGGSSELDEFLATGSELGLERTDKLFKELE